ncbi:MULTISPECIES: YfcL family protein [Alteromonadaceae]|uniref:YfcL family protein n=1 Tax=Alteromonadaceae TaxID=72275 RepID=UPI001C08FB95|nr:MULTISPECIES: YfcL family protein [unclassified Aliiglaciecola]MBU2879960.1 YfcL family protein [Aliiglaciecola lipolytica]MDO6712354.1 YfcL family protein [Aliiglaciecola sp. 2_MG-2023]MDO6753348.1 YfcL family protein [Aliiglaciecola sp. 1_MG-2023]
MSHQQLENFIQQAESQLDGVVETGTDDELFIAGYLHGHFSLVVSQALSSEQANIETLDTLLSENLNSAFEQKELEPEDQQKVLMLWQSILKSA